MWVDAVRVGYSAVSKESDGAVQWETLMVAELAVLWETLKVALSG